MTSTDTLTEADRRADRRAEGPLGARMRPAAPRSGMSLADPQIIRKLAARAEAGAADLQAGAGGYRIMQLGCDLLEDDDGHLSYRHFPSERDAEDAFFALAETRADRISRAAWAAGVEHLHA